MIVNNQLNCVVISVKSTILIAFWITTALLRGTYSQCYSGILTVPIVETVVEAGTGATPKGEQPTSVLAKSKSIGAVDP